MRSRAESLAFETLGPRNASDVHLVILVPLLPAGILGFAMASEIAPFSERRLVPPPNDGQPFAILRGVALHINKAGVLAYKSLQFAIHGLIVCTGFGGQPGAEKDYKRG